jgi:hypothetical protein
VVVVAPVLNLTGGEAFDSLRATDAVASELASFPGIAVVPVNLTLAALAQLGKDRVETPEDARALARQLGAEATVVAAITEYDPYDPPLVGWVMQWYDSEPSGGLYQIDPVAASREPAPPDVKIAADDPHRPAVQVQRVFNAAHRSVLDEVRDYAEQRAGHDSPYAWRKYVQSQELFLRYSCWSAIRSMISASNRTGDGWSEAST